MFASSAVMRSRFLWGAILTLWLVPAILAADAIGKSGDEPCPALQNATILIIRHAEKPAVGVELTPARQAGYDAIERSEKSVRHLQIKGRCLLPNCKPGQRLGSIAVKKDWDAVLLVLLDENFDATEMYEAERLAVLAALAAPGSKARNERGQLGVSKFKAIGKLRWRRE